MHQKLDPGTRVGMFTVEQAIGEGGFGTVYGARDEGGVEVAIKVSRIPTVALTLQELSHQQNEIEMLTRVSHPSLVKVLGHGFLEDGRLFVVMELVRGKRLDHHWKERGRLDAIEA